MTAKTNKINLRSLQAQSESDAVRPAIEQAYKEFKARRKESLARLMNDVTSLKVRIGVEVEVAVIPYEISFIASPVDFFHPGEVVKIHSGNLEEYFENLKRYRQPPVPFGSLARYRGLVYDVEFKPPIDEDSVPEYGLLHLRKDLGDPDFYSQIKIGFPSIIDYRRLLEP